MKTKLQNIVLSYLRILAKIQLFKIKPIVIGIAGSAGKTSLNYLLSEIISSKYNVKASKGKNSETGIPFDLLGVELKKVGIIGWIIVLTESLLAIFTNWEKYDVYVLEMGIDGPDEPKNMSYLLKIVKPNIALVTNISFEHSLYFEPKVKNLPDNKKVEKILELTSEQENLVLNTLSPSHPELVLRQAQDGELDESISGSNKKIPDQVWNDSWGIINLDDSEIIKSLPNIKAKKLTISLLDKNADFYCSKFGLEKDKTLMEFNFKNKIYNLEIPNLLPKYFAYEFLFALSICTILNIDLNSAISVIKKHILLAPGRSTIFNGIAHTTIIDSSYNNATIEALNGMLDFLSDVAGQRRRKVAIIGDMRELGILTQIMHEKAAEKVMQTCNLAILIGPNMKKYASPILKKNNFNFYSFDNFTSAKQTILDNIKENDVVLVKGSQNTLFLERCVEMLLLDKADISKLCRRGEFWDKKRKESL